MFWEKRKITLRVEICVEEDEDRFYAYCPALKGVHIDGKTEEAAVENAKIAIDLYIRSLIKHGDPIPLPIIRTVESQEDPKKVCAASVVCLPQQIKNVFVTI